MDCKASILYFVKSCKPLGLSSLPPSYFSMVNNLAVALMARGEESLTKLKKFISYWIEKIEVEVVEETCYEYPKYLLRNSLCRIHAELGDQEECLSLSNLCIRDIIANVDCHFTRCEETNKMKKKKQDFL